MSRQNSVFRILVLLVALLVVAGSALAQWSPPPPMKTMDLPAVNSSRIVTGTILDLKREGDDWTHVDLTIVVKETLKGEPTQRIQARVRSYVQPRDLDAYKTNAALLLIAFPPDSEEPITVINLSASDLAVFTADLKLLRKPEEVIRAVKQRVRETQGVTKVAPYTLNVPGKKFPGTPFAKGEDWRHDGKLRLEVPIDDRLERYAQRILKSNNASERMEGIQALGLFPSDANIGRLTPLLRDPAWVPKGEFEGNRLFRFRTNEVRRQAYATLQRLGANVSEPVSVEPIDRNAQVASVELENGNVLPADLEALSHYPNLQSLYLSNAKLKEADFAAIGRLSNLRKLGLNGSNIGDSDLSSLARLPHLDELYLENTGVTDRGLAQLAHFRSLKRLNLGPAVTEDGVAKLKRLRPGLRVHRDEFAFLAPLRPRRVEVARLNFRGWVGNADERGKPEPRYFALIFPAETADRLGSSLAKKLPALGWSPKPLANYAGADYIRGRVVPRTSPEGVADWGESMVVRDDADAVFFDNTDFTMHGWLNNVTLAPGERAIVIRLFDDRKR